MTPFKRLADELDEVKRGFAVAALIFAVGISIGGVMVGKASGLVNAPEIARAAVDSARVANEKTTALGARFDTIEVEWGEELFLLRVQGCQVLAEVRDEPRGGCMKSERERISRER